MSKIMSKAFRDQEYLIICVCMRRLGKELEDLKKRRAALRTSLNSHPSKASVSQAPGEKFVLLQFVLHPLLYGHGCISFSLMFICFTFGVKGPFVNDMLTFFVTCRGGPELG